jgi:hypothetical protein
MIPRILRARQGLGCFGERSARRWPDLQLLLTSNDDHDVDGRGVEGTAPQSIEMRLTWNCRSRLLDKIMNHLPLCLCLNKPCIWEFPEPSQRVSMQGIGYAARCFGQRTIRDGTIISTSLACTMSTVRIPPRLPVHLVKSRRKTKGCW